MEASNEKHLCFLGAHLLLFHDVVTSTVLGFSAAFSPLCPPSVSSFLCCAFGLHWWPPHCSGGAFWHKPFFCPLPPAVSELAAATKVEQSCACALGAATCGKSKAIMHIVPPRLVVESYIYIYILCILYMREKGRVQVGIIMFVCARMCVCVCVHAPPLF